MNFHIQIVKYANRKSLSTHWHCYFYSFYICLSIIIISHCCIEWVVFRFQNGLLSLLLFLLLLLLNCFDVDDIRICNLALVIHKAYFDRTAESYTQCTEGTVICKISLSHKQQLNWNNITIHHHHCQALKSRPITVEITWMNWNRKFAIVSSVFSPVLMRSVPFRYGCGVNELVSKRGIRKKMRIFGLLSKWGNLTAVWAICDDKK